MFDYACKMDMKHGFWEKLDKYKGASKPIIPIITNP
jgi:hypothetical protein